MMSETNIKYIQAPLTAETIKTLHAGDVVRISGYIYTIPKLFPGIRSN